MQSRADTVREVLTGTAFGAAGSWVITYLSFKYVVPVEAAATVSVAGCTAWSLCRGYFVRRYFAKKESLCAN